MQVNRSHPKSVPQVMSFRVVNVHTLSVHIYVTKYLTFGLSTHRAKVLWLWDTIIFCDIWRWKRQKWLQDYPVAWQVLLHKTTAVTCCTSVGMTGRVCKDIFWCNICWGRVRGLSKTEGDRFYADLFPLHFGNGSLRKSSLVFHHRKLCWLHKDPENRLVHT